MNQLLAKSGRDAASLAASILRAWEAQDHRALSAALRRCTLPAGLEGVCERRELLEAVARDLYRRCYLSQGAEWANHERVRTDLRLLWHLRS